MDILEVKALISRTIILSKVFEVILIHNIGGYCGVVLVPYVMVTGHIVDWSPDTVHYLVSHTGRRAIRGKMRDRVNNIPKMNHQIRII